MRYKLLALDLDGTALGSDPDIFAPGLAEAAAAAAERGCIVAAATGRPAGCLPAALDPVPAWMQWLVLDDGAEVIDPRTGARLWRRAFGADSLSRVEQAARRGGFPVEYIDGDSWYHVTPDGRRMLESSPDVTPFHKGVLARRGRPLEGPAAGLACRDILKINALLVPGPARDAFFAEVEGAALAMDCGGGAIELTAPGAGKLAAVAFLAGRLGLTLQDVMAIGDSGNDAALLAAAGLGVAMGNAPAHVQQAARAVTGRNTEGGATQAIRRWLLEG